MSDIPDFAEALQRFRSFLAERGQPDQEFWVFREDLWRLSGTRTLVRHPPHSENEALARKVFADGRARGLVEICAVAVASGNVAATVWFPKYGDEQVQGWDQGMKLTILEPLPQGRLVAALPWRLFSLLPRYRRYQEQALFIGARDWAGA